MDKLEKLSTLKLKTPKGLRDFIYYKTDYQTGYCHLSCVEVMEKWRGIWILRVFAYRKSPSKNIPRKYSDIQFQEIQRKVMGCKKHLVGDVWSNMSGRNVNWHYENPYYKQDKFWIAEDNVWEFYGYQMFNEQDIIDDLEIPYCAWDIIANQDFRICNLRFIDYIGLYLKEPKIELLVKGGYSSYLTGLRYLDLNKKSIADIFKVQEHQVDLIKSLTISDLLLLRKHPNVRTINQLKLIKNINSFSEIKELNNYIKVGEYLSVQQEKSKVHQIESIYNDYLRFAKEFNFDLSRNKYLYPKDLMGAHDQLSKRHDMIIDEKNTLAFEEQYKKFEGLIYEHGKLKIIPVKTPTELKKESSVLNHCVSSYASKVANGETEIFFVRDKQAEQTPFITVEVRNNQIIQVRGKNNCSPNDEVISFIKTWSKKNKLQCRY